MKKISIVIPAYNEEGNLSEIRKAIDHVFHNLPNYKYEIIFVNDGSRDRTQVFLEEMSLSFPEVRYIEFSRNFGHQYAVKAGLDLADGNAVISMDADLQHPPALIPEMIRKWEEGYDIVYTIRKYPKSISRFKRSTSDFFYRILSKLSDVELEKGSSDFRLLDASVIDVIRDGTESDVFLRGLVKWVGFRQYAIPFVAGERFAGESKYSLGKMFRFAFTGITAFSVKPLYLAAYLGFFFSLVSLLYIPYVIYSFMNHSEISGWASLIMTVVFFGGVQLIILGILGIYMGKIFKQIKGRPNYIIRSKNL
ncbi:dolichol-phosphate mannosyltransferase [Epilithonimonas bovis DSM 19482]|uniref:Dolichol-phosphate mannosyltransferase n=1 Tax=Epilithonimonas bovis DSM 19482 TaxID=1121284 RepID=A0A1U7PWP1_9FLAO|nr:glycosyltransferase family 2 protein [Epilithonimonas bovis]QIY82440.1 glycosyltransferase family 2 protein [Chryseobacterium sp. NEB161]SIT97117.1 dolichol-phosphate mannosyltransferase [Epilithonimonas bovis DSM 19482]